MFGQNRDYEFDRLKEEQERLFKIKQQAWEKQNDAWENLKSLRSRSGPRIDYLNGEQQRLFGSMKDSFERASSAFNSKDFVGAKLHSSDGKECKARLPEIVDERRRLVAELREAGDIQKRFATEFHLAKEEFEQADRNFKARLEFVKAQNQRKRDDKKEIARKAGVPSQYLDDVWITTKTDGTINIYFGGVGKPNGPGHGHYAVHPSGEVTYDRMPFDPHGSHNFKRDPELERRLSVAAVNAFMRLRANVVWTEKREEQYDEGNVKVTIKVGHDRRSDRIVSDLIVVDRTSPKEHLHIIFDQEGREVFSEWRLNH